jgi:type IV pilus assembly protein PilA
MFDLATIRYFDDDFGTRTIPVRDVYHTMKNQLRSSKGFTLVEIMIVVVIIGLLAAMAIPAFQKVRQSSQDKAVLNNARQLSAAADQYYLENGVSTVALTNLVGSDKYVKAINTVAGETYPTNYTQGITITIDAIAGARTVTYAP